MGWKAKGKLKPLWDRLPGKRDELAERTGIQGTVLSAYNSGGRKLGMVNAEKIADALGVSVYDLGAPKPRESDFALSLLGQIVVELERKAPDLDSSHLRELADELRSVATVLDRVGATRDDAEPPL